MLTILLTLLICLLAATAAQETAKPAKHTTRQIALLLPQLRADQWAIVAHPAKIKVLAMGRRWGKSVLGQCVALSTANAGGRVAWIVPTYKNGRPLWRLVEATVGPLKKLGLVRVNRSERTVEFTRTGGLLAIYSMDNPNSIRGESFHLVIVDEAAMIGEEAWTDCIQPTLADYDGDVILISTPKGRNWFWKEFQNGKKCQARGGYEIAAFTAPTSDNPNPNIRKAARLAQDRVSSRTYRQEWLAEFLEDSGTVFRGVGKVAKAVQLKPYAGTFVMGVDWGKDDDFTVLVVMDLQTGRVVDWDRFNTIGWGLQRGRLTTMARRWKVGIILAEENSIGNPNIELLQQEGLPILGFNTNSATKNPLIQSYALSIEREEVQTPKDLIFTNELEAYEGHKSKNSYRIIYSAPEGEHDDTVISGALADWCRLHFFQLLPLVEAPQTIVHYEPVEISPY